MAISVNRHSRIAVVDGLRALAVLEVVGFHAGVPVWWQNATPSVLTLLFALSGYMLRLRHRDDPVGWWPFVRHRLLRVFPVYWLAMALLLCAEGGPLWSADLPVHLLLLQSWVPGRVSFGYLGVAWFLSALLALYAVFVPLNRLFNRLSLPMRVVVWLAAAIAHLVWTTPADVPGHYCNVFPPARLPDFLLGMVVCDVMQAFQSRVGGCTPGRAVATAAELAALAAVVMAVVAAPAIPLALKAVRCSLWWHLPVAALLAALDCGTAAGGWVSRVLSCTPLRYVGRRSMEVYLFQYVGVALAPRALLAADVVLPPPVRLAVAMVVTVAAAAVVHRRFTVPIGRWLAGCELKCCNYGN